MREFVFVMLAGIILFGLCLNMNSMASAKNIVSNEVVISRKSKTFINIQGWLCSHFKELNEMEMPPDDIIHIAEVSLSTSTRTYFILARSRSGSGGTGGYLVQQAQDSYRLIYDGFNFQVTDNLTNDFFDIIVSSQQGAGNNYTYYYKYVDNKYINVKTTEYGCNSIFNDATSKYCKVLKKNIWTYKCIKGGGSATNGVIIGTIKYIIKPLRGNDTRLLVIEDTDKDYIAVLISLSGANYITSKYKDYKRSLLKYNWKLIQYSEGSPRDNIMAITRAHR